MEQKSKEKREQTLIVRYGKDWRKEMGRRAKEAKEKVHGKDTYSKAGKIGGKRTAPENRAFSRDKDLAKRAGMKGAQKRWKK